ncbi:MAG: nucleoside recognition protein [Deltaproteobacteria bacterium]|nr:MAG: nucleoside recognition protein [Deltaproteobacteria bacterium]
MNVVFLLLVLVSVLFAALTGSMDAVSKSIPASAQSAVTLSLGLIGIMALWLGLVRVAEEAGLVRALARLVAPVMRRLFPEVPAEHPAMSSMVMNIAANMLGLNNAATPLGLKAMEDLQSLNPEKQTATDAMALFLTINTSSVQLLPMTIIGLRASAGAASPGDILLPALLATLVSTLVGVVAAKTLARWPRYARTAPGRAGVQQ